MYYNILAKQWVGGIYGNFRRFIIKREIRELKKIGAYFFDFGQFSKGQGP